MSKTSGLAERLTFTTPRGLEYFNEDDLSTLIGCSRAGWPQALVKELIDNSLDACESKRIAPEVSVIRGREFFSVADNGPGIEPEVVARALDFSSRTSSNSKYVSPTRGQLGNALKCLVAAPAVLFPGRNAG